MCRSLWTSPAPSMPPHFKMCLEMVSLTSCYADLTLEYPAADVLRSLHKRPAIRLLTALQKSTKLERWSSPTGR